MKRERAERVLPSPESLLQQAIGAKTAAARAKLARKGLSCRAPLDRTTQSMLLRQLYLAHFEEGDFEKSIEITKQMLELDTLSDVCHQDAARAHLAKGDVDASITHLRLAARVGPAKRRAFHLWTLGSVLYVTGRLEEAEIAMRRAARWGTTDRPLYAAHLALIQLGRGQAVAQVEEIVEDLEGAPCGQGYGRFVLGMLCAYIGHNAQAARYLRAFLERTRNGRKALAISLAGELTMAERRLRSIALN